MADESAAQPASYAAPYRGFFEAIKVCFSKYADFTGRASRSEFWWFFLFGNIVFLIEGIVLGYVSGSDEVADAVLLLHFMVFILPAITVTVRRLHDRDHSARWLWLLLVPLGMTILFVVMILRGKPEKNRFDKAKRPS